MNIFSILGSIIFGVATILYVLLCLGFPLGEYALGGKYKILPSKLRIACGLSVLVQLFAIMIVLQTGGVIPLIFSLKITKYLCFFFAFYLSLIFIINVLYKKKKEKFIITLLTVIESICFWITAFNA